jgi:hypothetical protein
MRIDIEGDDSQFNGGKAKNIIAIVDGKRMILPIKVKIADLMVTAMPSQAEKAPIVAPQSIIEDTSTEIQREDLIRITNIMPRFNDIGGKELMDSGLVNGGIYRVFKVHQNMVTLPDKPDVLTKIINSYEVIDDHSAQPRLLSAYPQEVQLYKKREKIHSGKGNGIVSEFLKCPECNEINALLLDGDYFVGLCKCGHENKIERLTVLCPNDKCVNEITKERSKVSIFLYGDTYKGICGQCKQGIARKKEAVKA